MEKEDLMFLYSVPELVSTEEDVPMNLLFESLDATARLTNASMFVIDFAKKQMVYQTDDLLFVDEATQWDIQRKSSNIYWSLILADDFDIIFEVRNAYIEFVKNLSLEERLNHTFVIDYRIKLHGQHCMVTQKFTPLKLESDGNIWLGLFCITTSTHKSCGNISIFGNNFRYTYDFAEKSFIPFSEYAKLTLMEKYIVLRAAQGLTTEQIASDLCKSINTIKTHKSRLFEKLHVRSITEAITVAQNYNLY